MSGVDDSKRRSSRATKQQLLNELERLQRRINELERSADQHQRVNQAPREGAGQLSLIVDHLPALISYVDSDQRYCFVNSAYEKWFGNSQREVEGRHVKEVLGEPAYQAIEKYVTRALAGELVTYEAAVPYKDGGERYIDATYVPDFTQDGKVGGFFVLVRDISEPKRAEEWLRRAYDELEFRVEERTVELRNANEALSESEEQVRLLLNSTAEAIYGIDLEGNCSFANPACAEILGYDSAKDFLGKHMHDLIHHTRPDGTRYPAEECLIHQAFRRGEGTHVEDEVLWRRDGTSFAAEYWSYPVRRDGEVVGAVVTFLDITERRQAEEALRQAQKMEAVGQLTGGVAHDFNNLLAVVMGNTELLQERLGGEDKLLSAILRATERGAELTQRLLAFSRKQTLLPQAVELNTLVGGMTNLLRWTLGETFEIKTSSAPGLWRANVDPGQLENTLLNLAINARDAMPEGGTLVIETGNASLNEAYARNHSDVTVGDYVMLAVSDSGSGMSPEVLEHAMEPFFTTKEMGEGSGLGLAMIYGFAKQTGGHVAIYSEEGHGTTVKLYLPRAGEDTAQAGEETATEAPRARGETVLVVEDDADVRQLAVAMLEDLGYRVLQAPDGWAALLVLEESAPPDLLFSDMVLPRGLSGPDLAEKVKRELPAIKVLFMSGYTEYATRHNGLAGNGAELLNKPFRKRELALKVREVLDR